MELQPAADEQEPAALSRKHYSEVIRASHRLVSCWACAACASVISTAALTSSLRCQDGATPAAASLATEKFAAALKVKQAAQAGRFDDVEAELQRLDDKFTENHPKVGRADDCV